MKMCKESAGSIPAALIVSFWSSVECCSVLFCSGLTIAAEQFSFWIMCVVNER